MKATQETSVLHLPPTVAALLDPSAYPHPAPSIRLLETHISWIVLAGSYAYKVKKPVRFDFLDFSTLERREADCREELRLNRRLCRGLYLGVEWIVERGGRFVLGGEGRKVEPVVRMQRLPENGLLPRLLEWGTVDRSLVQRIARRLAAFHARAATGPGVDDHGTPEAIRGNWEDNFAETEPFVGWTLPRETQAVIRRYVERFLGTQAGGLEQRVRAHRIRDGHGDLHAASVCVAGPHLYLFDCLEFGARYRCADVAADLAFLAMDLTHYGRVDLADHLVDAYVRTSGDQDLRELHDFFACYRAYVRGKVLSLGLAGREAADEETAQAEAYFQLARTYAQPPKAPRLVVLMGGPGSGKSTVARALAGRKQLVHLSSDAVRKELAGVRPGSHQREPYGQGMDSAAQTRRVYAALRRRAAVWVRRGRSVVLDATYSHPAERAAVVWLARRLDVGLTLLLCTVPDEVAQERPGGSHKLV